MKRSTLGRLVVLALMLCLVTSTLISGTLAAYTSSIDGTGTAAVAKWSFKSAQGSATAATTDFIFTLAATKIANENVKDDRVAPGDVGMVDIKIDASGSEVAVNYTVAFDKSGLTTTGSVIKFYSDSARTTEISSSVTGTIALADVADVVSVPIYWKWLTDTNTADTTLGMAAASETFTVTVTGTQKTA